MAGQTDLATLIKGMEPVLNEGEYVFSTVKSADNIPRSHTICEFREKEGITLVLEKGRADQLNLTYDYIASWITLTIHSSLDAVGLTAAFSNALARQGISCNVIAGYYHDHLFIDKEKAAKAVKVLRDLANNHE